MVSGECSDRAPKVGRASAESASSGVCRHACAHHAEVLDPGLWSALPEHLLAHVFAHLPVPQIFSVQSLCKSWSATAKTEGFKRACADAHPKTFGIFGFHESARSFQLAAFDSKWHYRGFPKWLSQPEYAQAANYERGSITKHGALYAHDGGLVCFVPTTKNLPILVCNPLTNDWKTLPLLKLRKMQQLVMVQLVTDPATGAYRVMLVGRHGGIRVRELDAQGPGTTFGSVSESAEAYDSTTGLWSTMTSGYVYGPDYTEYNIPKVFDCRSSALHTLLSRPYFGGFLIDSTLVKNRLFALLDNHANSDSVFEVSELTSLSDAPGVLTKLNRFRTPLECESRFSVLMFACDGFVLLVADNGEENVGDYHHQLVRLYDTCRHEWHKLPALNDVYIVEKVAYHFMCELRWDVFP